MYIALAQTNPTVGDIAANTRRIVEFIDQASNHGVKLIVFPELAVTGYPPKDLLLKPDFIRQCKVAVDFIASKCDGITAIVGYPCVNSASTGRFLFNAVGVCSNGKVSQLHFKSLLPTYDVFDESRYFEPGGAPELTSVEGKRLGISICEDMWNDSNLHDRQLYHDNPIAKLAEQGADFFINCSASPFVVGKHDFRLKLFSDAAHQYHIPLIYVNQVGGNDELVFDGNSCVIDTEGKVVAQAKDFEEDLLVVDLVVNALMPRQGRVEVSRDGIASVYEALVLGLRDYCVKCGFGSIVIGLSGGIDSAVTAAIAVGALGAENVTGIGMPSRYSSSGSKSDAEALGENLGLTFHMIGIDGVHNEMEKLVGPYFEGRDVDATEENLQARLRGVILMSFSNKLGSLLVTTGNKSEMAVGYATLYGDMCGGLSVLSDVPKTMVYDLAKWINTKACPLYQQCGGEPIPVNSITKPPSAELRPDQVDQDSLPPYEVLDEIIDRYVEREQSALEIVDETEFDAKTVNRIVALIDRNEYKRKQAAPGIKVTSRAFGFGRRVPIAQRYDATGVKLNELVEGS